MARVLFVGDPHLKINNLELAKKFLTWLNQLIAEQKPDIVVNLGDTFDTHAVIRSEVMTEFMNHVYHVLSLDIPYVYLLGNHDMFKPSDPKYHAMKPYKDKIPNLYVIDETTDLFGMTFVPYKHNIADFPKKTLEICVAHQTFLGADYGLIKAEEGVDALGIQACELIISGHIHKRGTPNERVLYVGSPFSQSASDVDQIKGISILDTGSFSTSFIQTPLPSWRSVKLEISDRVSVEEVNAVLALTVAGSLDHWILELSGPKAEVVGYLGSDNYKQAVAGIDIKVKTNFTDKEKKKVSIEAKSMEHIVSEYVNKVYSGSIDKNELLEKAKAVLNESRLGK